MKLIDHSSASLTDYVVGQIASIVPDGRSEACRSIIAQHLDAALMRTGHCIDAVRPWRAGEFNYLHSSQYCIFLYYLANSIWRENGDTSTPTRLFLVNKALNGIDLFYEIEMPKVFFIGHSVGIVLAKATYGEQLVLYQNSTVGRIGLDAPVIGQRVVIYPNCAVIGRSRIADGTVLSQGTSVINRDTESEMIVFGAGGGALTFKPQRQVIAAEFFR